MLSARRAMNVDAVWTTLYQQGNQYLGWYKKEGLGIG
jgi:hypothetical protein